MKIETFKDGYILIDGDKEYKYKGKADYVIDMISDKVKELLVKERKKRN